MSSSLNRSAAMLGAGMLAWAWPPQGAAADPKLGMPVGCGMRATCAIQKYVDLDPTAERRDYRCGRIATDAHDGTDIRLRRFSDLKTSAPVIAAAAGRVLRVRDGMADANVRETGQAAIAGRLAGNGIVIDHGDGWETQYSHMKRGSVAVRPGQQVAAGDRLGAIGMSGNAEFPHLHFEVRHNGTAIDPFSGRAIGAGCTGLVRSMWTADAARALVYRAPEILAVGIAASAEQARADRTATVLAPLQADPPALIIWADVVGAQDGDIQTFRLRTSDGTTVLNRQLRVDRGGLSWFAFAGLRKPATGWVSGKYTLSYLIERNGKTLANHEDIVTVR